MRKISRLRIGKRNFEREGSGRSAKVKVKAKVGARDQSVSDASVVPTTAYDYDACDYT